MNINSTKRKIIATSFMGVILYLTALLFDPYVTAYLLSHGFSKQEISYITALAPLSLIIFPPIMGKLSDILGRRRIINLGLILFLASQFAYLYVGYSFFLLISATLFTYIGFEAAAGSLLARTEDGARKHRGFTTGMFESLKHVGSLSGIAIGTYIVARGPIENNLKLAICFLIFLLIFNNIRPNHNHHTPSFNDFNPFNDLKDFLKIPELRPMAILGISSNFTNATRSILVPVLILETLNLDIKYVGFYLGAIYFGHLFQFVFGYLCEKFNHIKIINMALVIYSFSLVLLGLTLGPQTLLIFGLITGFSLAAWNTSAWTHISEIGEKYKEEGMVVGSYTSFASMGSFLGYITCGIMLGFSAPRLVFFLFAAVNIVGIAIANIYFHRYNTIK